MQQKNQKPKRSNLANLLLVALATLIIISVIFFIVQQTQTRRQKITFNDLVTHTQSGQVQNVQISVIGGENIGLFRVTGRFKSSSIGINGIVTENFVIDVISTNQYESLVGDANTTGFLATYNVGWVVNAKSEHDFWSIILSILPILVSITLIFIIFRSLSKAGSGGGAMDFTKSRAKLTNETTKTFKDVAGADEEKQELAELVDFLKNPKKYLEIGARIPKGVLLSGNPGTGKTLLAKAIAGEANVPFFTISGSDFVELFVGVGAGRVRDLFKNAKANSPCIIFIDEIDAVGRQRGAGLGGGNDEREQTLNQLLVEMDGFTPHQGIIIIAATNRPDVLDPALLRPGRFDRQITINLPDLQAREQILEVHARNKKIDPTVTFNGVARRTPGFSGADLENVLNEAALLAARDSRMTITLPDIDEAIDRVMMGPAKKSKKYNEAERKMVAYHEAGHAVIGIKLPDANVVQKITIIPRGLAGGYNLMMPENENFFATKKSLLAEITSFLGGRVAEELNFDSVTNGAYNDFQRATAIARAMVTEYGMSDLGPIQYESNGGNVFLGRDYLKDKNFSDQVASEIDKEVRKIITSCYEQAKQIISTNKDLLDNISKYLLQVETINKQDIDEIVETGHLSWADQKNPTSTAPVEATSTIDTPTTETK